MNKIQKTMPIVALRGMIVLPGMLMHFDVSRGITIKAVEKAMVEDQMLFVVAQKDADVENPAREDLFQVGTVVIIKQMVRMPGNTIRVMVVGVERASLLQLNQRKPYLEGEILFQNEDSLVHLSDLEKKAMLVNLKESIQIYGMENSNIGEKSIKKLMELNNIPTLVDETAMILPIDFQSKQNLLSEFNTVRRYEMVLDFLLQEIEIAKYRKDFQIKVKAKIDKGQRDYLLREQMKVIKEELGEGDSLSESEEFYEKLRELQATAEIKEKIKKEIDRYKSSSSSNAESNMQRR
ncbi:MAG: LON peptidase substrate-binding domain-containing protein, partial [Lachnospiraceae bacterium]|nr:LON peptidase substrate-binding domain-containing protein [Lachnospiraceae bacterium]